MLLAAWGAVITSTPPWFTTPGCRHQIPTFQRLHADLRATTAGGTIRPADSGCLGSGTKNSAEELHLVDSFRRILGNKRPAHAAGAWLCSRVEDSPRPSAPAGEILRTRGAGNHRPRERLGPSNTSKFHGCSRRWRSNRRFATLTSGLSVVDGGRTVGSLLRRQGCQSSTEVEP